MSGPRALAVRLAGVTLVMLGAALAFGEDAARLAPPDPDPGLLEFLGSVDGLAEVSPDYLAQAERARVARLAVKGRQIGRASCREREEVGGGGGLVGGGVMYGVVAYLSGIVD